MFRVCATSILKPNMARFFSQSPAAMQKLYVGNLSWTSSDETLRTLFSKHGEVTDAFIVRDRLTGKSRGFGFVEMSESGDANSAVEALNGFQNDGRPLRVNLAEEKPPRSAPRDF